MKSMTLYFAKARETKNTIRFEEVNNTGTDTPKVGTLYIPKATLTDLGWDGDSVIQVTLSAFESR